MSQQTSSRATRFLPQVVVATTVVAVLPVVVVWVLFAEGVISSPWVCLGLGIALSLAASAAGSAYWKRRGGHGDVLFSELLLWGWLHRYRAERRLANAVDLLGLSETAPGSAHTDETTEQKAQILRKMAGALDAQDPYLDGHSRRVALHAAMIARKMGLPREEVAKVRAAAAVHDIGKLRTPPEVLNKSGALTAAEFEVVKHHVDDGAEIVSAMEDPEITATVRHHHERFDGHGYPDGLVGQQTPVAARIIAVADTFDALTSVRPYRAAIPHKKALRIIVDASGSQLDPVAVRAFLKCYSSRRWVLFWTLLAASPQRAFASGTGRLQVATNLGSVGTVATPAAVAAIVAAAVGTAGRLGHTHDVLKLAQQPPPQVTAGLNAPSRQRNGAHRRTSRHASHSTRSSSPVASHAVVVPSAVVPRPSRDPGSGRGSGVSGGARVGTGGRSRTGSSSGNGGGGSRPGGGGTPTVPSQGTTPSPPVSRPPVNGGGHGGGGGPGNGGSQGGGGNQGAGGGGSQGGGGGGSQVGGSGSGGGQHPQSKADCKNGGFVSFGFRNQGQCVASVEHSVLHGPLSGRQRAPSIGRGAAPRRRAVR